MLSTPKRLRPNRYSDVRVAGAVLRIFVRAVRAELRRRSPGAPRDAELAAVSFPQDLRLHGVNTNVITPEANVVKETTIRAIGNSAGTTIPKALLERYKLSEGDRVHLVETEQGILITPFDPAFARAEAMSIYQKEAKKYRTELEVIDVMLALASRGLGEAELAAWLRDHTGGLGSETTS